MSRLIALTLFLFVVAGCSQVRPLPPPSGCVAPAWKLLPGETHPGLFSLNPAEPELASPRETTSFDAALTSRLRERNKLSKQLQVLVLSGGSQNGAFGAGLFRGLAQAKGIPEYDVVTAVSTGALQSTLIFLANQEVPADRVNYPAYMSARNGLGSPGLSNVGDLALAYAVSDESDLLNVGELGLGSAILHGSLANFRPMRATLNALITIDTIRAVAKEGDKNRSLFVGVTNLDDGYGYAIDLTQLSMEAVRDDKLASARECYIEALIASSTVPPGVPPISLTINNGAGPQLFMDGGARFGVFFAQLGHVIDAIVSPTKPAEVTVVVNGGLYGKPWVDKEGKRPEKWSAVSYGLRTVDLLQNQVYRLSINDVEEWAKANGRLKMAFISNENLNVMTSAPEEWSFGANTCKEALRGDKKQKSPQEFHPSYMRCIIDYGQNRGLHDPWNYHI